jgi:selenocysteine lyase/cysteine desulfurase
LPPGIEQRLAEENIHVSLRGTSMRITPHLYNTPADTDRLVSALGKSAHAR